MKELTEYRQKLLDRFAAAATEFREACLAVEKTVRPAGGRRLELAPGSGTYPRY